MYKPDIWTAILESLRGYEDENRHSIWTDGEEILCPTEAQAEAIADLLEDCDPEIVARTGYYDPEEDKRNNEVNDHTGYWYVDID